MDVQAWDCNPPKDERLRYVLATNGAKTPLICIGINPSTADRDGLDPTTKKLTNIAENNNFDGWIMLNIYPLRKTRPSDLSKENDELQESEKEENKNHINEIINNKYPDVPILCAWGTNITKRTYFKTYFKLLYENVLKNNTSRLKCLGYTNKKHPKHPLYCLAESKLIDFNIEDYPYLKKVLN